MLDFIKELSVSDKMLDLKEFRGVCTRLFLIVIYIFYLIVLLKVS